MVVLLIVHQGQIHPTKFVFGVNLNQGSQIIFRFIQLLGSNCGPGQQFVHLLLEIGGIPERLQQGIHRPVLFGE